jgi:hypothetical protein
LTGHTPYECSRRHPELAGAEGRRAISINEEATTHVGHAHAPDLRPDVSELRDGQARPDAESALGDVASKRLRRVSGASSALSARGQRENAIAATAIVVATVSTTAREFLLGTDPG